jgi:short-subunit dehydrogenase
MQRRGAVVVGASAGVGRALAESLAREGYDLVLAARDPRDLEAVASDLQLRHCITVVPLALDLRSADRELDAWIGRCRAHLSSIDAVLVPAGTVDDADDGVGCWETAQTLLTTNFLAVMKLSSRFLSDFGQRNQGTLVLFSSVAAAAPRRRNVVYAAAKAALESYACSMQHRFHGSEVRVQLYALGYIDTSMSRGRRLLLPAASPTRLADLIVRGLHQRRRFVYFPRYWAIVAFALQHLPWHLYRRLDF